jgi:hypothetical protein
MRIFGCQSTKWIPSDFEPPQALCFRQEKLKKPYFMGVLLFYCFKELSGRGQLWRWQAS